MANGLTLWGTTELVLARPESDWGPPSQTRLRKLSSLTALVCFLLAEVSLWALSFIMFRMSPSLASISSCCNSPSTVVYTRIRRFPPFCTNDDSNGNKDHAKRASRKHG